MIKAAINNHITNKHLNSFQLKAVFFDMDGVLYDSMPNHASSWVKTMNQIGIPFSEEEAYMSEGKVGHATIDSAFLEHKGRTATEEEKNEIYSIKTKHFESNGVTQLMPYAMELLNQIKKEGLEIYVVTGSGQKSLIENLQANFPGIFEKEKVVTAFDVKKGKPSPEPYLKALSLSRMQAHEAIVIENAPLGVESAKAAGLFTIAVNTGPLSSKVLSNSGADIVFDGGMKELYANWHEISMMFNKKN